MKITKQQLKKIIKEELETLSEQEKWADIIDVSKPPYGARSKMDWTRRMRTRGMEAASSLDPHRPDAPAYAAMGERASEEDLQNLGDDALAGDIEAAQQLSYYATHPEAHQIIGRRVQDAKAIWDAVMEEVLEKVGLDSIWNLYSRF